jgi:hypothetical protein
MSTSTDPVDFESFARMFPDSSHAAEARTKAESLRWVRSEESKVDTAWARISSSTDPADFDSFARMFPDSSHAGEARAKAEALRSEAEPKVATPDLGGGAPGASQTGPATTIGGFKQWTAYKSNEANGKMCFIAAHPTDTKYFPSRPKYRDPAYFMVTMIPAKKIKNEASTIIGYAFKKDSKVTVDVEGKKFTMFTDKDNAWIENTAQEATLISAMKSAKTMTIEGISQYGTTTTDTYSLSGLGSALDAISKACPTL